MSRVVATFHPSDAVVSSLKWSFQDQPFLLVARTNSLHLFAIHPDGLRPQAKPVPVWGRLLGVWAIPGSESIVVLLDHPEPELIFMTPHTQSGSVVLKVAKQLSLFERAPRIAEYLNAVVVHPFGRLLVVSVYAGKLKVVQLDEYGIGQQDWDVS
jgi:DNA damage-binding protein 1